MILQKILFPHLAICRENKLYFRGKDCIITETANKDISYLIDEEQDEKSVLKSILLDNDEKKGSHSKKIALLSEALDSCDGNATDAVLFTKKNSELLINTYFNAFSVFKWKKYTNLKNLFISLDIIGDFEVKIENVVRSENENKVTTLFSSKIFTDIRTKETIEIPFDDVNVGLIYIKLTCLSASGVFFGGEFFTDIDEDDDTVSPVKIAIAMCTYKREKYVESNIGELSKFLIDNEKSPLHGNLELYIADNSESLDVESLEADNIHIFPNKNLGGAGGFGRAMYEILNIKDQKQFTNIIMMDDDVKFDPAIFERLFAFLTLLKEEYAEAHIGGAMLELDKMWMQSESGEYWYPQGHRAVKHAYDLTNLKWILKNEIEDTVDNFGWWFCCMPISVVREDNLPVPFFIKRDDIEYGVRNGRQFINLNGVSVWHEAFDAKRTPFLDYYYYRNPMILNAAHCESYDLPQMLDYYDGLRCVIDNDVNLYRYKEAHLKLKGIDDFLKGIDWLKSQDAVLLNQTIIKRWTYQLKDLDDVNAIFVHGEVEKANDFKESEEAISERLATNNGWDGPPRMHRAIAPLKNPPIGYVYGAEKIVYFDENTHKGYVTYRSYYQRDAVYKHYEMTRKNLIENYDRVRKEYNKRFRELTDISFWRTYLFEESKSKDIPVEWWENVTDITDQRNIRAIEKLEQYNIELEEQRKRVDDYPIVNNRVVIYLYQRRGFTCNVKYILKELLKEAGDDLEIIWVSDYPETCDKVRELGIPVIKAGTKEHWEYYFTARVNITSDSQPPYFLKRDDQVLINAWHGGISYKVIGYDCLGPSTDEEIEIYGMKNRQPDYWLAGSQRFIDDTAVGFKHDKSSFAPTGMARNDIFFSDQTELIERLREELGIPKGVKVAMYAPTFRRGGKDAGIVFNIKKFKEVLSQRFGGEWVVLYRGHYFIKNNPKLDAIDVSQYDDMQELLYITDVLVSDYSSCLWDFSFTKRPSFVYATDLNEYEYDDRGFFIPIEEWPYPIAGNAEDLFDNILNFNEDDYVEKIRLHHEKEGSFEKGDSAKKACEIITKACEVK